MARRPPDPPLVYAIADPGALGEIPLSDAVAALADAGVRWIQLRLKRGSDAERYRRVEACRRRLEGAPVDLWIDDRADLAVAFALEGLHLGQRDLPPAAARRVVGERCWIGASSHDDSELAAAAADPEVDVVAVGAVFPTASKARPEPVVGLDFVRRARRTTTKPLVAIGGIDAGNAAEVLAAGADSVAVLGAVSHADVGAAARRLLAAAEGRS